MLSIKINSNNCTYTIHKLSESFLLVTKEVLGTDRLISQKIVFISSLKGLLPKSIVQDVLEQLPELESPETARMRAKSAFATANKYQHKKLISACLHRFKAIKKLQKVLDSFVKNKMLQVAV